MNSKKEFSHLFFSLEFSLKYIIFSVITGIVEVTMAYKISTFRCVIHDDEQVRSFYYKPTGMKVKN